MLLHKRTFLLIFSLSVSLFAMSQVVWNGTQVKNWTGSGTLADPYLISTAEQLAGLADTVNKGYDFQGEYIRLTSDIYLSNLHDPDSLKHQWTPIAKIGYDQSQGAWNYTIDTLFFRGHFNGDGHTIFNLYYNQIPDFDIWGNVDDPLSGGGIDFTGWNKGLFGCLDSAVIENLYLDSAVVIGASTMGGIAAIMNGGRISNCTVSGRVVSANSDVGGAAGGIVGQIQGGVIEQCISHVNVSGIRGVGSFVGQCLEGSTIRNSSSTGQAHCTQYHVGGFAGVNSGLIEQCYATGNVSRSYYSYASTSDCAGFVGWNQGAIKACYSTGDVTPSAYMQGAGFCGTNTLGQIESCYSTGTIYVSEMYGNGAIFCSNNGQQSGYVGSPDVYGIIINCFTTGRVVRSDYPDNISDFLRSATFESKTVNCSFNTDSAVNKGCWGGTFGLTTAQMQSQAFVDTLNMVAILSGTSLWQYRPGQYPVPTGIKATSIVPYLAGGVGSEADPFLISNINQLTLLSIVTNKGEDFRGTHFKLTNDIAMNVPFAQWGETMPTKWNAIGHKKTNHTYRFRGIFDGDYHELSNLYIDIYDAGAGLFGFLEDGAHIKNLGVVDAWVKGNDCVGILVAASGAMRTRGKTRITQCWTSGLVEDRSWAAAGLIGTVSIDHTTVMKNCYSSAIVTGTSFAGGSVGDRNKIAFGLTDTVANVLFMGTLNHNVDPFGREENVNCFYDKEVLDKDLGLDHGLTTAKMQTKEFVNRLNYYVSISNSYDTVQIDYWQHNPNNYPTLTKQIPPHSITFDSRGGNNVMSQLVLDSSRAIVPNIPSRPGYVFNGWCTDSLYSATFLFDSTLVTGNLTLYAQWTQEIVPDYSIFENPFATSYTIRTKEQLAGFACYVNGIVGVLDAHDMTGKIVKLGNDIVVNDTVFWKEWGQDCHAPIWQPIGASEYRPFKGTFDGQGYSVIGLYINKTYTTGYEGLFGYLGEGGTIKNVGVKASYVGLKYSNTTVTGNIGLLLGYNYRGLIDSCYADGKISTLLYWNGLLVGNMFQGVVRNCYAIGVISGKETVGGLIGGVSLNATDSISNCYAHVEVSGSSYVGGLIGNMIQGTLYNCYATGNVQGTGSKVGGLVGNGVNIYDCYASGDVTGNSNVGGLVGSCNTIYRSYASGEVSAEGEAFGSGRYAGGLVGSGGSIYNSYATGHVSGTYYVGGLSASGNNIYSSYATGNVTATGSYVGGLIGEGNTIKRSYALGNVVGLNYVGGLIGQGGNAIASCAQGNVTGQEYVGGLCGSLSTNSPMGNDSCFARGNVQGVKYVGGFVGNGTRANIHCYSTGEVQGDTLTGGFVGWTFNTLNRYCYYDSIQAGHTDLYGQSIPRTTENMKRKDNYETWNFNSVWGRKDTINDGFPYLRWMVESEIVDDEDPAIPLLGIALSCDTLYLHTTENPTHQLSVAFTPLNATEQSVTWSISDSTIATISSEGLVTALISDTATIYVTALDGGYTDSCLVIISEPYIRVTSVTITSPKDTIAIGESIQLEATVYPENATNKSVTWSCNSSSLSVDEQGLVTGLATGRRISVNVSSNDPEASWVSDGVRITVIANNLVTLDSAHLINPCAEMSVGESCSLSVEVFPVYAQANTTWQSSDLSVVTVATDGTLTAVGSGIVTISAIVSNNNNTLSAITCVITVSKQMQTISWEQELDTLYAANMPTTLTATASSGLPITYTSSNPNVASIVNNSLQFMAEGTVTITASQVGNANFDTALAVQKTIVLLDPPISVTAVQVTPQSLNLDLYGTASASLSVQVLPTNATNKSVQWSTLNSAIATVASDGLVTAVAIGSTYIKVTSTDGGFTDSCLVQVVNTFISVTGLSLDQEHDTLQVGEQLTLIATVSPNNASDQRITWSSSNEAVATVNNGVVMAHAVGTAQITVTTVDGEFTALCNLVVQNTIPAHPDMYLFGDGIPNSQWSVPPTNPLLFVNHNNGTYTATLSTTGGHFAVVHEDALQCPANDWGCLNSFRYAPNEDGTDITNQQVPINYAAEGAFYIRSGEYKIELNRTNNTIMAVGVTSVTANEITPYVVYGVEGTIYVEHCENFIIYDMIGRDVTSENGHLKGVYLVRVGEATFKVIIK